MKTATATMPPAGTIIHAYPEWDDRDGKFRVYLVRADGEGGDDFDSAKPMQSEILGESIEARLYRAAFCAHPKDFRGEHERVLGFDKEPPAKRAAAAVKKELKAVAAGKDGPSNFAIQIACVLAKGKRK